MFFVESTAVVPTANSFGVWQLGSKAVFRFVSIGRPGTEARADNTHSSTRCAVQISLLPPFACTHHSTVADKREHATFHFVSILRAAAAPANKKTKNFLTYYWVRAVLEIVHSSPRLA